LWLWEDRVVRALDLDRPELEAATDAVVQAALRWLLDLEARRVAPETTGDATVALFAGQLPEAGLGQDALDVLPLVLEHSRGQNGRFFGYVLGSGEPVGVLGDVIASAINQNVTSWRSAPAATVIEQTLVTDLARELGCAGFSGSFCGGGSFANLMGLAMAREARSHANEVGTRPGRVYASSEAHMSIGKALALLGLGRENLRSVPVDERFKMCPDALRLAVQEDTERGLTPLAVVASTGTVMTGAVDPLVEIAAVAREHDLYLHVDGAYGGFAALAEPALIGPLALADSVSLDAHKWLYQPVDCGLFLFKDGDLARRTFSFTGDYTRTLTEDPLEGFAFFEESLELSRRFRALKLWLSIRYHGLAAYRNSIREDLELARELASKIAESDRFELLAPVELSAVCFGLCRPDRRDVDQLNQAVLRQVNARGRVYISNATINDRFALRACITNHRTTRQDVAELIQELEQAAN
jgi:aromatic-L-amino-acid/L-tryptophan decarboxylase